MGNNTSSNGSPQIPVDPNNNVWLLTSKGLSNPLQADYHNTVCHTKGNVWDCYKERVYTDGTDCVGVNCNPNDLSLGSEKCPVGWGQATKCSSASSAAVPQNCPKIAEKLAASSARFNVNNGYVSSGKDASTDNQVKIACQYNLDEIVNNFTEIDANTFYDNFSDPGRTSYQYYIPNYENLSSATNAYNTIMNTWCGMIENPDPNNTANWCKNNSCLRMSNSQACTNWGKDYPNERDTILVNHCKGENLSDPACIEYCQGNITLCSGQLSDYCKSLDPADALKTDICACYMAGDFYDKYYGSLTSQVNITGNINNQLTKIPQCSYAKCAASSLNPYILQKIPCPDIQQCISNVNVNNDGTINGDITINSTNDCTFMSKKCGQGEILDPNDNTKCIPTTPSPPSIDKQTIILYVVFGLLCALILYKIWYKFMK
jgi:hypothetical protein